MSDFGVVYIGCNTPFFQALRCAADSLHISLQAVSPPQFSQNPTPSSARQVLILDTPFGDTWTEDIRQCLDLWSLVVLIADQPDHLASWSQLTPTRHDVLVPICDPRFLAAKLAFYRDVYLCPAVETGHPAVPPPRSVAYQASTAVAPRLGHVQEQLSRLDVERRVLGAVLEKIRDVSQLSRRINCLDLDRIASVCVEEIPRLIGARYASLYRYDPETAVLHLLRHNHSFPIDRLVLLGEHRLSPMAAAVRRKNLLMVQDLSQWIRVEDPSVARLHSGNYQSNSCIIAPLVSADNVLGVLNLADKIDAECFDRTTDLAPVELLCEILGSAMANLRLYDEVKKQARTDGLTGLLNYRTFYAELEKEVRRSQRYGGGVALLMIDLDNLKHINDEFGHRAGDTVLLHVADRVLESIRHPDRAARYGGDEFAVILPRADLTAALAVGRRILDAVHRIPVPFENHAIPVSVSVGVGQCCRDGGIEEFINASDAALFAAKNAGKNRIHVAAAL